MALRDPKQVFIGVATGNGQEGVTRWETSMSLISLIATTRNEYEFVVSPGGGCDIAHARNLMTHEARTRTACGIYGNLDSDLRFNADGLHRILRWFRHPEVDVVAGRYPLKDLSLRWSYNRSRQSDIPGLLEVDEVCTGCLFYRAEVIDALIRAYPDSEYQIEDQKFRGETGHELFAMGPVAARDWNGDGKPFRRRMSEDFMFSMRLRDLGYTLYVDPSVSMGHIGPVDYLKLHAHARPAPPADKRETCTPVSPAPQT